MKPNPLLVKINTQFLPWKKVAQSLGILPQFSQTLPNVNSHPNGENWPNLVTLFRSSKNGFRADRKKSQHRKNAD
jgi:hypothetical protein